MSGWVYVAGIVVFGLGILTGGYLEYYLSRRR